MVSRLQNFQQLELWSLILMQRNLMELKTSACDNVNKLGGLIQQELNIDLEKKNSNKAKRKLINKINRIILWLAKDINILL